MWVNLTIFYKRISVEAPLCFACFLFLIVKKKTLAYRYMYIYINIYVPLFKVISPFLIMVLPFYMIYLELHVVSSSNQSTDFFFFWQYRWASNCMFNVLLCSAICCYRCLAAAFHAWCILNTCRRAERSLVLHKMINLCSFRLYCK